MPTLFLIAAALTASIAAQAEAPWPPQGEIQWKCTYSADVLPQETLPAWMEYKGQHTQATLEDGALHIVDSSSEKGSMRTFRHSWFAIPEKGTVVEARIKVIQCDKMCGVHLLAADGVHEAALMLYPGRIVLNRDDGPSFPMDTTDGFHCYRMATRGDDLLVWVDGKLAIDGQGAYDREAHAGRNMFSFGAGSSAAISDAYYDDVRYAIFGEEAKPPTHPGAENIIVYKKKDVYACFPSLTRLEDGTLTSGFGTRTRRSHIDSTGGSARYVSKDNGRTWQEAPKDLNVLDPALIHDDGTVVIGSAYGWRQVPEERRKEFEDQGITVRDVKPGVVAYLQGACARRSTDRGQTWTKQEIDLPPHGSLMNSHQAQRCLTRSGVFLAAPYGRAAGEDLTQVFILRSEDKGLTWTFDSLAKATEPDVRLNETALIENGQGEIIALMRSEPPRGGFLYESISADEGKTWSPAQRTAIWGYPPHLLKLADGRILCSYGYRRGAMGIRAVLSSDGGHTWDTDNPIILRTDGWGNGGDLGYPISIETTPGQIFTIYYITNQDGITHIAGTLWNLPQKS